MAPTKPTTTQPGKKPVPAATKDEGDADDPIAKSLAERTKAGSISAVIGTKNATTAPTKPQAKPSAIEKKPATGEAKKPEDTKKPPIVEKPADKKPADEEKKKPTAKSNEETKVKPKDEKKPTEKVPVEKKEDKKLEIKVTATKPTEEKKSEPKKLVG